MTAPGARDGHRPIGVGVIGLGFMGRTHLAAFESAGRDGERCEVVAVCDQRAEVLGGGGAAGAVGNIKTDGGSGGRVFDPARTRAYSTPDELLQDAAVDLVSICTPTPSHVDLAVRALRAGKHVLVEKPVAITSPGVERLLTESGAAPRLACVPAMCMRHWPGWTWLREQVVDGAFGRVLSARFERLGSGPSWSREFYENTAASGGAVFDLHVHDADFVTWCFGAPASVESAGTVRGITTLYRFDSGPEQVTATGSWEHADGFGFRMRYLVNFERATAEFDLARPAPLVLYREGRAEDVALPAGNGYDAQARHVLALVDGAEAPVATIREALIVTRVLEAEVESLKRRGPVTVCV